MDEGFVQHVKKCSLGMFLGAKSKDLGLQNHANRKVHPAKNEEDRFCTVYQSMQLAKKANNKTGVYFRKSAARIQYSSLTLG